MLITTECPEQATVFDALGIYRLLSEIANIGSVEAFIHRWLGTLLDSDTTKDANWSKPSAVTWHSRSRETIRGRARSTPPSARVGRAADQTLTRLSALGPGLTRAFLFRNGFANGGRRSLTAADSSRQQDPL
jgi:hypothetical protein